MMCQPVLDALKTVEGNKKVLLTSPKGKTFNQEKALSLSKEEHLVFICGHYEGLDARIEEYVDESISLVDFILIRNDFPFVASWLTTGRGFFLLSDFTTHTPKRGRR